jgi:hypothetical protein
MINCSNPLSTYFYTILANTGGNQKGIGKQESTHQKRPGKKICWSLRPEDLDLDK